MLALLVVRGIRSWRALVAGPRRSGGQLRSSRSRHADQSRERTVLTILDENARAYIRESIGHRPPVNSLRALTMRPRASRPYTAAVLRALSGCSASGVYNPATPDAEQPDNASPTSSAPTGCWPPSTTPRSLRPSPACGVTARRQPSTATGPPLPPGWPGAPPKRSGQPRRCRPPANGARNQPMRPKPSTNR
jgi:hypothetical protein